MACPKTWRHRGELVSCGQLEGHDGPHYAWRDGLPFSRRSNVEAWTCSECGTSDNTALPGERVREVCSDACALRRKLRRQRERRRNR